MEGNRRDQCMQDTLARSNEASTYLLIIAYPFFCFDRPTPLNQMDRARAL